MDSAEQVLQWLAEEYQADPGNWSAYADEARRDFGSVPDVNEVLDLLQGEPDSQIRDDLADATRYPSLIEQARTAAQQYCYPDTAQYEVEGEAAPAGDADSAAAYDSAYESAYDSALGSADASGYVAGWEAANAESPDYAYADSTYDAMPADAGEPEIPDDLALADGSADAVWKAFSQLTEEEAQDLVNKGIIAFEYATA